MLTDHAGEPAPRLALCSVGELFGGVERHILGLCRYWRREGRGDPLLVLFREGELAREARQQGLEPVVLFGPRWDPRLAGRLAGLLRQHRIEVVHAHGYKAVVLCALACRRGGFALVKTEHGRSEPSGRLKIRAWRERAYRALDTMATHAAVDVVCYVTEDLRRHYGDCHRGTPARTVPNGIDPISSEQTQRPADLEPGLFQVTILGRVSPVKGIDLALEALADDSVPTDLRLNVVGTGSALEALQRQTRRLGLGRRVRFLGFRHDVYDLIAHSDLLLMPSRHEGLPYTLLEGMSLGTPVAAARVGGLAEVLIDGETGLLFPPGDTRAIREACLRLHRDRELGGRLATAARRDLVERYSLTTMAGRYEKIYQAVRTWHRRRRGQRARMRPGAVR